MGYGEIDLSTTNIGAVFDAALEALQPGREELARTEQTISLLRRKARYLRRALATKEKAIEAARQTFQAADADAVRIEDEIARELRGLDLSDRREDAVRAKQSDDLPAVEEVPV